jgi:hypothetical protein
MQRPHWQAAVDGLTVIIAHHIATMTSEHAPCLERSENGASEKGRA